MKKIIILGSLLSVAGLLQAQEKKQEIQVGMHANVINTGMQNNYNGAGTGSKVVDYTGRLSYKAGFVSHLPLSQDFYLAPELSIVSKGGKINFRSSTTASTFDGKARLTYLELPVNAGYSIPQPKGEIFFAAGPSISIGLGGKVTGTNQDNKEFDTNVVFDGKMTVDDGNTHYKAFELGANELAGYQFNNGMVLRVFLNYGLTDVEPDEEVVSHNWYYGAGVGYVLRLK